MWRQGAKLQKQKKGERQRQGGKNPHEKDPVEKQSEGTGGQKQGREKRNKEQKAQSTKAEQKELLKLCSVEQKVPDMPQNITVK